jgi:hypothetical protein
VKKVLFFIDASFRALGPTSVKAAQLANNVDDILAEFATCNILKAFLKFYCVSYWCWIDQLYTRYIQFSEDFGPFHEG